MNGTDNKLMVLVLVFLLVFGVFSTAVFFDTRTTTRATNSCEPVAEKSFVISVPKDVPEGESCDVTVVARCEDETVVTGADVTLNVTNGTYSPSSLLTDENGTAVFSVTGTGLAEITATVNNSLQLNQTVTCEFQ